MYNRHDNLNGGTRRRITAMRGYANTWNVDPRRCNRITWRNARMFGIGAINTGEWGLRFGERGDHATMSARTLDGFRARPYADTILCNRNGGGYYADADCEEVLRGQVWQLPARDGSRVYIAGYVDSLAECVVLDANAGKLATFDDETEAARAADHIAERFATEAREYSEKYREAQRVQEERDGERVDLKAYRRRFADMARAYRTIRATGDDGALAGIREVMDEARDNFAECLARIVEKNETLADFARDGVDV